MKKGALLIAGLNLSSASTADRVSMQSLEALEAANTIPSFVSSGEDFMTNFASAHGAPIPEIKREFRGVWVASVANINWPPKPGMSVLAMKQEAIKQLDHIKSLNLNAVVFQVRPACDALYRSPYEPLSPFISGTIGKQPACTSPEDTPDASIDLSDCGFYDPLNFWVKEAHKRGLELHAWLNPYRAHHPAAGETPGEKSLVWDKSGVGGAALELRKGGMWWLDPADERTKSHVLKVITDLATRYELDGLHMDDYFYPYKDYFIDPETKMGDFPDHATWNAYIASGGNETRADWRRGHVNDFVERAYNTVQKVRPLCKFGISPFGIWKDGVPADVSGSGQYDDLYADAKLWFNKGWVDYFVPQLYWPVSSAKQPFTSLLDWWRDENLEKRHYWPGLNTVAVKVPASQEDEVAARAVEIIDEIRITRERLLMSNLTQSVGEVHYSLAGLYGSPEGTAVGQEIRSKAYPTPAAAPASPWVVERSGVCGSSPNAFCQLPAPEVSITHIPPMMSKQIRWKLPEKESRRVAKWQVDIYYTDRLGKNSGYVSHLYDNDRKSFSVTQDMGDDIQATMVIVRAVDFQGEASVASKTPIPYSFSGSETAMTSERI